MSGMNTTLDIRACRLRRRMLETVQAAVIISCLLHSSLYAAEMLTLSDISPKQAGAEVAVGGMGTGKITIRIFKPQETVVWKKLATKGRPDHFWDASFTLPQAVTGR